MDNTTYTVEESSPHYLDEAFELNELLKGLGSEELMKVMKVSEKLFARVEEDINVFGAEDSRKGPALLSYSGTVFQHIDAGSLSDDEWEYARNSIRILSGMFGYLKPSDLVYPYRLEMKAPIANREGTGLYHFWKKRITESLIGENCPILNLTSAEYGKAVDFKKIDQQVITVQFREKAGDRYRTVGMYSKMARGKLTGRIIRAMLDDPAEILEWNINGYAFNKSLSSENEWFFTGNWRI